VTVLPTYNVETLARIDVVFADGVTDQVNIRDAESIEDFQERVKNLYHHDHQDDDLDAVAAYDYNGDQMASITPIEFFGPLGGF
jgi:hypothetical protein